MSSIATLPIDLKSQMAFKLQDGSVLLISKEDCREIAKTIVMNHIVDGDLKLFVTKDDNVRKAEYLMSILNNGKKIEDDIRIDYLKQILFLLSNSGELKDELINEKKQQP